MTLADTARECFAWAAAVAVSIVWCGVVVALTTVFSVLAPLCRVLSALLALSAPTSWTYAALRHSCILLCRFVLFPFLNPRSTISSATMTRQAVKFTPEVMLSAPRRSPAIPSPDGREAIYSVGSYSFETHKKASEIRVLDLKTRQSTLLAKNGPPASDPVWLNDEEFIYVQGLENGKSALVVDEVSSPGGAFKHQVYTFEGAISNLKVSRRPNGDFILAFSALANPDGTMANPETQEKPHSSAKVYTELFVRHWDSWLTEARPSIWIAGIEKLPGRDRYIPSDFGIMNLLAGTKLSSPVPPFGGAGDFDLHYTGVVFVAKDPDLDPAIHTKTDLYFIDCNNFVLPGLNHNRPIRIETPGLEGYSQAPVFSHSGRMVAFTRMRSNQYESDKPRIMIARKKLNSNTFDAAAEELFKTEDGEGAWDCRPESLIWDVDDQELYVTAEQHARTHLFKLSIKSTELPVKVGAVEGSVADIRLLSSRSNSRQNKIFVTSSSLVDNSCYSIIDPKDGTTSLISSASKQGKTFGLNHSSCSDMWFKGAGDYDVHALVMKPSNFDENKKYPLAFLIHGGPQGAWLDGWSTRWNPAIFAEQGYVVVAPNPTGSTGYGMAFQDGIKGEWGGRPYNDLVACFECIAESLPYVDTNRAVALGASYGGYMINWIQGNPLGRKFKALVCHDGVFSTLNQWSTEELFFPIHDFGGTLWENRAGYEQWDPARHLDEWATPQLIIHSELDYRLPITEGLAAFNVLRAKRVESKFLMFPDENHWVIKVENSLVWHREVLGWINHYTGVDKEQEEERREGETQETQAKELEGQNRKANAPTVRSKPSY